MFAAILSATIKWQEKVGMYSLIAENLIYPLADLALGTSVMKYFCQLQKTQWWPVERLKEMQDVKLAELISHCHKNVPYYRDLFTRLGLTPADIQKQEDLRKLPIISKQTIRENFKKLTAHRPDRYKPIPNSTGGSTGEPLQFYIDKDVVSINWAGMFRGWEWAGYKPGDKRITFGGSSLIPEEKASVFYVVRNMLERNLSLSAVSLTKEKLDHYVKNISSKKPRYIYGYPSSIYMLADHCRCYGINMTFNAVFSTAEVLLPNIRQVIETEFKCRVFDQYGSYDGGAQALECEKHSGFHITVEKCIIEIVDECGNYVAPGQSGRIIVTDLHNYAMPFIRYETGDIGKFSNEPCSCGRGLPLLKAIEGRTADFIKFPNGVTLTGPAITLMFKDCNIEQYQLVQTGHNILLINVVKGERYSKEDEERFLHILKHHAGSDISVTVNYCDSIPPGSNNKFKFIINRDNSGARVNEQTR